MPTPPPTLDPSAIEQAVDLLQKRIDLLQENLAEQNKLATLGMVAAVLAHEFNNILTPMISYTTVALSEKSDDALKQKALTKALAGAQRLAAISQSLLGFAKGDAVSEPATTANVKHAITETLSCLARDLSKDSITLTLDIPETLTVAMNPTQLQQVLMNLIVNARAALLSPQHTGPKRLTIKAEIVSDPSSIKNQKSKIENPHCTITLADTGPGIPAHILPKIFDPFFSTKSQNPTPDPLRGGTGLGLTICHQLLTNAGGSITAHPTHPKGATFTLTLPL